jgi:anaerobic glycerol-3-phosphate dehydrogenase
MLLDIERKVECIITVMSFFEQQIKFANKKLSLYKKVNLDTIRIEILNPKARKLLKNLADLKLIKISDSSDRKSEFKKLLDKLRTNSDNAPSLEEIEKEVETVRKARYEKENSDHS